MHTHFAKEHSRNQPETEREKKEKSNKKRVIRTSEIRERKAESRGGGAFCIAVVRDNQEVDRTATMNY